jgi:hypothetical protein
VDFAPISDHHWREERHRWIWDSHIIPKAVKMHLLHFYAHLGWMFFPLSWSSRVLTFLSSSTDTSHDDDHDKTKKVETKVEGYGYQVSIEVLKNREEPIGDALILKELA